MSASVSAYFVPDGDRLVATEATRGPWSREHQHGGPPAALVVRAMELTAPILPASIDDGAAPPGPPESAAPLQFPFFRDPVAYHTSVETRLVRGTWGKGPVMAWMRPRVTLVEGEALSPLQRLLVVADSASGLAGVLEPDRFTFVNADLTVAVHRAPEGDWVGVDAATVAEAHGVGLTRARLWDARGALGVSLQSCLLGLRPT